MSLMVIFIIFYVTACGVKSNNTSKSPLRQTKDMAENVYDAISFVCLNGDLLVLLLFTPHAVT